MVNHWIFEQEGNHTPSTKPILPERVPLPSENEIPNLLGVTGNELHDRTERGPMKKYEIKTVLAFFT